VVRKSQDFPRNSKERSALIICNFIQGLLKSRLAYAPRSTTKAKKKSQTRVNMLWLEAKAY
jgi:hypothetical protein